MVARGTTSAPPRRGIRKPAFAGRTIPRGTSNPLRRRPVAIVERPRTSRPRPQNKGPSRKGSRTPEGYYRLGKKIVEGRAIQAFFDPTPEGKETPILIGIGDRRRGKDYYYRLTRKEYTALQKELRNKDLTSMVLGAATGPDALAKIVGFAIHHL